MSPEKEFAQAKQFFKVQKDRAAIGVQVMAVIRVLDKMLDAEQEKSAKSTTELRLFSDKQLFHIQSARLHLGTALIMHQPFGGGSK